MAPTSPRLTTIRAVCRCGYPFDPDIAYPVDDGADRVRGPWRGRHPKRYCSRRCARAWPARDRAAQRRAEKRRAELRAWEAAGQLTLW